MKHCSLLALSLFAIAAQAQQTPPRAVPVDNVPRAVPVKPAEPLEPVPGDNKPVPRAQPVEDGQKAKEPGADLFDYAMLAFGQKDYVIAAESFAKYVQGFRTGSHASEAFFKLAECYRQMERLPDAAKNYQAVVNDFPKSDSAPLAAYWLGGIALKENDYKGAATFFGFAASRSTNPKVKHAAGYYQSDAYLQMKDRKKQLEALKPVIADKTDNDFLEKALLAAATAYQADGNAKEALPLLLEVIETSKDPAVQGDASLKAAIIQGEQNKGSESVAMYDRVIKNTAAPADQRGAAMVGLISELYSKKDYEGVVDIYNRNASLLPPSDLRPRMMLYVGNAHRMKKTYSRAIELYDMIQQYYPEHELTFEAAYWKVYCLYLLEDKGLVDAANAFVKRFKGQKKDHEFINTAQLLIADFHFTKQNYKLAADAYAQVEIAKLQERFQPSTLFHKGWSEAEAGKHNDAISTLTLFIKTYPKESDLPSALAKRGLSYKLTQNNSAALADFQTIINDHAQNSTVELALYLSGVIHSDQRDWKATISDFESLLKKFPASPAGAEASYKAGLAYVELKDTDKALPLFRQAVQKDSKAYGNLGTQKVLLCLWNKKDVESLSKEVDDYRSKYSDAVIPPNMLGYLGLTFFDRKDFNRSAKYLTWAATPDTPENTDLRIWNYLGQAMLEVKNYDECIKAIENFLNASEENMGKAKGYLTKASAELGLNKPDDAIATADEGLKIVKAGGLQGQLLILQGDALLAEGDKLETDGNHEGAKAKWSDAAKKYVVPSQVIKDDYVTPLALDKAAQALERVGDKAKADEMRAQLKKEYPNYKSAP